jgi:hypothetical protein
MNKLPPAIAHSIESAEPLENLDEAGKRRRYEAFRAKLGVSKLFVKGKPGIHYLWADRGDRSEMATLQYRGYKIVREPHVKEVLAGEKEPEIVANGLGEDGTYCLGDVILVQCSQETYDFICLANSERHEDLTKGAQRDFIAGARERGVPVFDDIQPKRKG